MIKESELIVCYHCGENCDKSVTCEGHYFCCQGCKTVYEIINKVELCDYYTLNPTPGKNQKTEIRQGKFAFIDDEQVQQKLIQFKDSKQSHVTFYLPQMHCSSCIWLLENLNRINKDIVRSQVNFLKKELTVVINHHGISLRKLVEILTSIGYEPHLSLHDLADKKIKKYDKEKIYKIGIAGFCFGNIMLLSFPEYFSSGHIDEKNLQHLFSWINLVLSLPVFFYCASEFFMSALKSIRQRFLNIDTPIALAILITFGRSLYEIISGSGAGYLDSMSGIVFFMLIGRFFQNKTYDTMSFNRDYTSYFPLGVTILDNYKNETQIPVSGLKTGHRIKIHHQEIIPADCILFQGKANIDYSFVSGESLSVEKNIGEIIYAGGKQLGGSLEMEVVKDVSQSYLTQLWNNEAFKSKEVKSVSYIHITSKYFTLVLFTMALATACYWYFNDSSKLWNAVTSILIVACPCALLLSATFTNGNMLRVLQKFGFYVRNAIVIEDIANADTLVFDKTGTITPQQQSYISYEGSPMSSMEEMLVRTLASQSNHPLSKAIVQFLPFSENFSFKDFEEIKGFGIRATSGNNTIAIGSAAFLNLPKDGSPDATSVYVSINHVVVGHFKIRTQYRSGLAKVCNSLKQKYNIILLSGDNNSEQEHLQTFFGLNQHFNQTPQDKLNYIKSLQQHNKKVMMLGDGLNDAGALKQSNVGIAITDNINNFSPACDVIMDGKSFGFLNEFLEYCSYNKLIINTSFVVSIIYNIIGLYYAVQGQLQPVIAAILMPVSSISIVLLTTSMSSLFAMKLHNKSNVCPVTKLM